MNVNKVLTRDYEKRTLGERGKNKPKTNPIQTQNKANSNPISQRVKLMQSLCLQRIMKNNADMGYEKTNPIKPNFKASALSVNSFCFSLFFAPVLDDKCRIDQRR